MEPLTTSVANAAISSFLNKIVDIYGEIDLTAPLKQQYFNFSKAYVERYAERHGHLKVLGMSQPVSLEDVYTSVQVLDAREVRSFETPEGLEALYRQRGGRGLGRDPQAKQAGIAIANREQYLMVLGGPGIGKSTFLRKMGLEALKDQREGFEHNCIPVLLELKYFDSEDIDIRQKLIDEFVICGFPNAEKFTERALEKGRLLVLFDGLDEVPKVNLDKVIELISNFVDRHHKNRFIASCRIAAYHGFFKRFTEVVVADFDDGQIQQFIDNWFRSELDKQKQTAESFWQLLKQPHNKPTKDLARTPLLLTFLCLVYDDRQTLPPKRSTLYSQALDIILEKWAAEKRIQRGDIYPGLHTDLEKQLLADIAHTGFARNQLFMDKVDLVNAIRQFLGQTLEAPKTLDAQQVLTEIEVQQGILVQRAEDVYSFSHLTLQEFLTAFYIEGRREIDKLVRNHLTDYRWREVFLLVAGLMRSGVDDLLLRIEQQARSYLATEGLRDLLHWAGWAAEQWDADYRVSAKRMVSIYFAFAPARALARALALALGRALALARAHDRALAFDLDRALDYARACDFNRDNTGPQIIHFQKNVQSEQLIQQLEKLKQTLPKEKDSREVWRNYADKIDQVMTNTFDFTKGIFALSEKEWEALANYLQATHLMVQCKDAAIGVPRETWEAIENRILVLDVDVDENSVG